MLPYASTAEAEAALGRSLRTFEPVWFHYSARMPDYILFFHSFLCLLIAYTLAPLPVAFLNGLWTLGRDPLYIPFYGGPEYHDYHHYIGGQSQSNYASIFTYCDYLYGTNKLEQWRSTGQNGEFNATDFDDEKSD
ncbi:very-long-chain aldehyde decarbonylase GL1-10-like [Typha latifolia]|uniref:very-long-chain aldehyde decarbonylase GL1-10-like n=1 Tax=Typha latifolia TaxID=4733 RepID=UPI003C2C80D9